MAETRVMVMEISKEDFLLKMPKDHLQFLKEVFEQKKVFFA
jgi:hypothetical protein